jgi:hypothetical protein
VQPAAGGFFVLEKRNQMTVSTSYEALVYNGNGVTTSFPVTWQFFSGTLVVTEIEIATGTETVKTLNTHYTVSGGTSEDGLPTTGAVVAEDAPSASYQWRISRVTPRSQSTTWSENDAFPQKVVEAALDRLTLIAQEESATTGMVLATAGLVDYWDASGYIIRNVADPEADDDAVTKGYGDAHYGGAAAIAAAGYASAASISASNAATSASNAQTYASQATNASGFLFAFDSSTSMADPGSGDIRLNHATLSSVTAIAISDLSGNTGNPDVSASILSWDDSTSVNNRGTLTLRKASAPQNFVEYAITGASTYNSGWTQLAVTHRVSSGSFSNADTLVVQFVRSGDQGASGSGTGDMLAAQNLNDLADKATARTNLGVAIGTNVQAFDADLSALAALNSTGIATRTATNTWAQRTLQAPAAGFSITNPAGVAGDPTFALANDLAALEGLSSAGIAARTGTDTWAVRTLTGTANEIEVTNGNGVSGNPTLALHSGVYRANGTDVPVADGGTGVSSFTAYAPIFGGTTGTGPLQSGGVGTLGQVLTSNGAGSLPTFQTLSGGATLLSTLTTTSGSTQSATSLAASQMFIIVFRNVSVSSGSSVYLNVAVSSNNGSSYSTTHRISVGIGGSGACSGICQIMNVGASGSKVIASTSSVDATPDAASLRTSLESSVTGTINALRFSMSENNFDAGTIYIFGVR